MKIRHLPVFLFLLAHLLLGGHAAVSLSPTYDEPLHLTAGYVYWDTGDYRINGMHHPPFAEMWSALPLLVLDPFIPVFHPAWLAQHWGPSDQYNFANKFLYFNKVPHDKLLVWGRLFQILLSCFFGILFYWIAARFAGTMAGYWALGLWCFSPTIVAHGSLVSTDLAFAVFFFLFFASFLFPSSYKRSVFSGIALGLCFASKYLAVAIIPICLCLVLWGSLQKDFSLRALSKKAVFQLLLIPAVSVLVIFLIYRFHSLEVFWGGISQIIHRSQTGRASFLFGERSTGGRWEYFPLVFLIKTPLPVLLGMVLTLILIMRNRIRIPGCLWIPPLLFFGISCFSKVQIGVRHIMVVYPFVFFILAACLVRFQWSRVAGWGVLFWTVLNSLTISPHFLAFFNEAVGGPRKGYLYLTDSNLDWGQGLKLLKKTLPPQDQENGIYLSYFGVADPNAYGIKYVDVLSDDLVKHSDDAGSIISKPTKFAISLTNLQGTYYADPHLFGWLKQYRPWAEVGHSMFIFDFSSHPDALERLEKLRLAAHER